MTPQDQVLDRYRSRMDELTAATVDGAQALYGEWDDGDIDTGTAVLLLAALINRANATAVAYADEYLSLQITVQSGEVVPPVGIPATDDSARLADAVSTILEDDSDPADSPQGQDSPGSESSPGVSSADSPETPAESRTTPARPENPRLTRLAQTEPWSAGQQATSTAMQQQPLVEGWQRILNEGACRLCQFFAARGRVFPTDYPFKSHPNCQCTQRVVLVESIKPVRERKRRAR